MSILFLCREQDLDKERRGYARALRQRGERLVCLPSDFPPDGDLEALRERLPDEPSLIVHPEPNRPTLPRGLTGADVPTACFQIDTFRSTAARIRLSMLFGSAVLFHPGFEERFRRGGHPRPITLGHAVEFEAFERLPPDRPLDVASVGRLDDPVYATRRRLLTVLSERFRMNDWGRRYTYEEMADVLRHSRIGINIPRDDYPPDANLRCFEVMAAGALLITRVPSELEALGFRAGEHFVGYRAEAEVVELVRAYLGRDGERRRIAQAARELVLAEHTYDRRAAQLLEPRQQHGRTAPAPAHTWPAARRQLLYVRYYATRDCFDAAWRELGRLRRSDPRAAAVGLYLIAKAAARHVRTRRALPTWRCR